MDKKYIDNSIQALTDLFSIKDSAPSAEYITLLRMGQVKECIEAIAKYLNLPIRINLLYVSPNDTSSNQFKSQDLVSQSAHGVAGITAQVLIPASLPFYGSEAFKNLNITVKISENCRDNSQTFIAVMGHELSHIVLNSLWYKDKENEVHTDLTAMILGFADAMKYGRKVVKEASPFSNSGNYRTTSTTTYGYLSDELFDYAYERITYLKQSADKKLEGIRNEVFLIRGSMDKLDKEIVRFKEGLKAIDAAKKTRKMSKDEFNKIVSFHQTDFLTDLEAYNKSLKLKVASVNFQKFHPLKSDGDQDIQACKESFQASRIKFQRMVSDLVQCNKLIIKWMGLKQRLAFWWKWRSIRLKHVEKSY